MADQKDGGAFIPAFAHKILHLRGLFHAQRGSRFVHHEHPRAAHQCTGAGDALALSAGHTDHSLVDIRDRDLQAVQFRACACAHLAVVEKAEPAKRRGEKDLASQKDVCRHVQRVDEREILIDRRDPFRACGAGIGKPDRLSVKKDPPAVGAEVSREDVDERGFPGSVPAYKRMDLPGAKGKRRVDERIDSAETFGKMFRRKNGCIMQRIHGSPRKCIWHQYSIQSLNCL